MGKLSMDLYLLMLSKRYKSANRCEKGKILNELCESSGFHKKHALVHADESKTKRAIPVPLNKQALSILKSQKDKNPIYVFTYQGKPVSRCNNHA